MNSATHATPLFDPRFLEKIEYLSLVSRRAFRGRLFAQRGGRRQGTGIEFADHRNYSTGDDVRYIDWNVYARHGELLLKRFQEEEDLHVYFLLDCSRSMDVGVPRKFDYARRVLAALAYIALDDLDGVGITTFVDDARNDFSLVRGKQRIHPILRFLEHLETHGNVETNLQRSVRTFVSRRQRRGLVIVISDLYDPAGFRLGIDLLRHERYEPYLVHLYDRQESNPPPRGEVELVDIETNHVETVTITRRRRREYLRRYQSFLDSIENYCRSHAIGYLSTATDRTYDEAILDMMRASGILVRRT